MSLGYKFGLPRGVMAPVPVKKVHKKAPARGGISTRDTRAYPPTQPMRKAPVKRKKWVR